MLRKFILLLLPVLAISHLSAQTLIGTEVKCRPSAYSEPKGELAAANAPCPTNKKNWIVFSDRDNNTTYSDAACTVPLMTATFMEKFVVIEESSNALRIAKPHEEDLFKGRKISMDAVDYGWIDKSKLLLWTSALCHRTTGFKRKALAINSKESLDNPEKYLSKQNLRISNSPDLKAMNGNDVRLFTFLFIFKEDVANDAYLIGRKESINASDPKTVIEGWVSRKIVTDWNERIVLAPNADETFRTQLDAKSIKIELAPTAADATNYMQSGIGGTGFIPEFNDFYRAWKLNDPYVPRLPILEHNADGVYRTGMISNVFSSVNGNMSVLDLNDQAEVNREHEVTRSETRVVNLVFIIDGSESMSNTLREVYKGILETMKVIYDQNSASESYDNNEYHLGAVVYREPPKKNEAGTGTELIRLKPSYSLVLQELKDKTAESSGSSKNRDLFRAMKMALEMEEMGEDETNIMVVIGGAGNSVDELNQAAVQKLLTKKRANMMTYQVIDDGSPECRNFLRQTTDLMKGSAQSIKENNYSTVRRVKRQVMDFRPSGESVELPYPDQSPVQGRAGYVPSESVFEQQKLVSSIQQMIKNIELSNNALIYSMDSQVKGLGKMEVVDESQINYIAKEDGLNAEQKEVIANSVKRQFFVEGYVPLKCERVKAPLFKHEVFLTENEFKTLLTSFSAIRDGKVEEQGEYQQQLATCLKKLAESLFGGAESHEALLKMTAADILAKANPGLPIKSEVLRKYNIEEIERMDPNTHQDDLDEIDRSISKAYNDLSEIGEKRKMYSFAQFGSEYWWIPADLLP